MLDALGHVCAQFCGFEPRDLTKKAVCTLRASQTLLRSVFFHRVARKSGFFLEDKQQFLKYSDKENFISRNLILLALTR